MEPAAQVEIQLGHMCNNRCVFCTSGQQTELGRARPLETQPIIDRIDAAFAQGMRKLTLLGGEPTLQPGFKDVLRRAVELGFEEIVVFTNGVKTARPAYVDELLAIASNITWRISLQGATKAAHERTTKKSGSFDRIVRSLENLHQRGEHITVNMCVVQSNFESVSEFPALILPFDAQQLHLDMVRPLDAGERSDEDFAQMIPHYSDMVPALRKMVAGFPDDFDVNIGNLPYCIAPDLAPVIHHDGERTYTVAVNDTSLSDPWDKYEVKRRDKGKPESCQQCVFEARCNGVFDRYVELYGTSELVPVSRERLARSDPKRKLLWAHLAPLLRALRQRVLPGGGAVAARPAGDREVSITVTTDSGELRLALVPPGAAAGPYIVARTDDFDASLSNVPKQAADGATALGELCDAFVAAGYPLLHPPAVDLFGDLPRGLRGRLSRLRQAAPFGDVTWSHTRLDGGERAELVLTDADGSEACVWLAMTGGKVRGGYTVAEQPSPSLVDGVRSVMRALSR